MRLSEAQKRALKHLINYTDWTSNTPVTQKCLSVLHEKGLVQVSFDADKWAWVERITDKGREIAKDL